MVVKRVICFVELNCHFIFMLFGEGNKVSAVEYVSRMWKYRLSSAVTAMSLGRIMVLFFVISGMIIHLSMNPDRGGSSPIESRVSMVRVVVTGILFHV